MKSELFTMLVDAVRKVRRAVREVSDPLCRSQIKSVASAIEWTLKETKRLAGRDPGFSPLYAFTLVYLISGVEYLYIAEGLGIEPPHDERYSRITSQSDLCRILGRIGIEMDLAGTAAETLDFLLKEAGTNLNKNVVVREVGIKIQTGRPSSRT